MDGKYNTGDEGALELKKALKKSPASKHPIMSDAEKKLKFQGRVK